MSMADSPQKSAFLHRFFVSLSKSSRSAAESGCSFCARKPYRFPAPHSAACNSCHIGLEIIQILAHRFTIVPDITHRRRLGILPVGYLLSMRGTLSAEMFLSVIVLSFGVMQPLITAFSHTDDIAQAGLQYGKDQYDRERYAELRQIAAEMLSARTGLPTEKIHDLFCNETGYQTPKVDTRAAVFADGRILLAHENNGT